MDIVGVRRAEGGARSTSLHSCFTGGIVRVIIFGVRYFGFQTKIKRLMKKSVKFHIAKRILNTDFLVPAVLVVRIMEILKMN